MRRIEQYQVSRGDNIADPGFWNPRLQDIDDRINNVEAYSSSVDGAVARVEQLGIERVNAQLNPLVAEALAKITSVASLLEAGSATSVAIVASGQVTFTIAASDRTIWPLPSFVSASVVTDPAKYMAGRVVSLDRATGALVIEVLDHGGAGTFASWVIRIAGMPGDKGDPGIQGDKGDTGSLSGNASNLAATAPSGFTGANVQAVLTSLGAAIQAAVASDQAQETEIAGKALLYHTHAQGDVTGLATTLAAKAALSHQHGLADIPDLTAALAAKGSLDAVNTWTKQQGSGMQTLTDGATISWDVSGAQVAKVTLGGNRELNNPANAIAGFTYILEVVQDATGGRTLSFGDAYSWPDGTAPVVAPGAGKVTILTFIYNGTKMRGVASLNY